MIDEKLGIITMGEIKEKTEKIPEIGIGMLGYAFMGKAHSNAFKKMPYIFWPPPAIPKLIAICGRNKLNVSEAAKRYNYLRYYTYWKDLVNDHSIDLFVNSAPNNLHVDPCIQAAENNQHILCEKPLARNSKEANTILRAVKRANVKHLVGFNYRFIPAIQVAKKLIDEGRLGEIYQFHARYLQEWIVNPSFPIVWRLQKEIAGSGVLGDLGSHIVDLAHLLIGNIKSVNTLTHTFIEERPLSDSSGKKRKVDVDDVFESIIEFTCGAVGHLSASRLCPGRKNYQHIEIYGEKGSISFNLERLNELKVHIRDHDIQDLNSSFHDTLVSESHHPYWKNWWPHGLVIGWEHTAVNQAYHFIDAIINEKDLGWNKLAAVEP